MTKWVIVIFMLIHISFEIWGKCNVLNRVIFNTSLYSFISWIMYREYRITKHISYFVFACFWGYFVITELWTCL